MLQADPVELQVCEPDPLLTEQMRVEFAVQIGVGLGAGAVVPELTVNEALLDLPPKLPVIVAEPLELPAENAKLLLLVPELTITEAGTFATAVLLLRRETEHPEDVRQLSVNLTVPVIDCPNVAEFGLNDTEEISNPAIATDVASQVVRKASVVFIDFSLNSLKPLEVRIASKASLRIQ